MAMRHNEHEVPRVRNFAAEHGFDMVSIRGLSIFDSVGNAHDALVPAGDRWRAYSYDEGTRVKRDDFVCQYAFSYPTVLADGTVTACDQDYNGTARYGTVAGDRTFSDVWFGAAAAAVRRIVRDSPRELGFCRSCAYADRNVSSCSIEGSQLRPIEFS
jgi:radical SAM protein with 4Fe4S-binding SPASM domain